MSIDNKKVQLPAAEIFTTQRNLSAGSINQILVERETPETLRSGRNILAQSPNTTGYGIENAHYLASLIRHEISPSTKSPRQTKVSKEILNATI